MEDVLRHDDGKLYELGTFVVMPNHVHVLVLPKAAVELSVLLRQWKGIAARRINDLSATDGSLWAPETYDHIVRNQGELMRLDVYIRANPVKAGLREGAYRVGGSVAHWFFMSPSTSGTPA